jgi:protein gp37
MALRKLHSEGAWWDTTWQVLGGCLPISEGCRFCYAARHIGTLHAAVDAALYRDTTEFAEGRHAFNGTLHEVSQDDPVWTYPLDWKGHPRPLLGPGRPSLIFVNDMTETFLPRHSKEVLDRTFGTLVSSEHIGQVVTKLPKRMVAYLTERPMIDQQQWKRKLWVGFSAEDQANFDLRWPAMRGLAEQGWTVFVSVAPMLDEVRLPDDFLKLGKWVICAGEQGRDRDCRLMDERWAEALRDQCAAARVPFFMKQLGMRRLIPPDLLIRQFPAVA